MKKTDIYCELTDIHDRTRRQTEGFSFGRDLALSFLGLPSSGLSARASDLLEIGAAVFRFERMVSSGALRRAGKEGVLRLRLRDPAIWSRQTIGRLEGILHHMGSTSWSVEVERRLGRGPTYAGDGSTVRFKQVMLFSGGLDSACGAALAAKEPGATLLFGYSTRRASWQRDLAHALGPFPLTQLREEWNGAPHRGRSFFYRGLFFLFGAAAVAESLGARVIVQAENGVLASGVPPAPSLIMTRHATPWLQREVAALLNELFGGPWQVANPLMERTKKESFDCACVALPELSTNGLLQRTDSCWSFNALTSIKGNKRRRKDRGVACGRCIPCIVRRTVFPHERVCVDLRRKRWQNDPTVGAYFRSIVGFLSEVRKARNADEFWFRLVSAESRRYLQDARAMDRHQLFRLFCAFGDEVFNAYGLSDA